jgi:hypothetical protein
MLDKYVMAGLHSKTCHIPSNVGTREQTCPIAQAAFKGVHGKRMYVFPTIVEMRCRQAFASTMRNTHLIDR